MSKKSLLVTKGRPVPLELKVVRVGYCACVMSDQMIRSITAYDQWENLLQQAGDIIGDAPGSSVYSIYAQQCAYAKDLVKH